MKIYIDDIRNPPEGWTVLRNITQAISFISRYVYEITEISIDHDIEDEASENFTAVAYFISILYFKSDIKPVIKIHSGNTVGAKSLYSIFEHYDMNPTFDSVVK